MIRLQVFGGGGLVCAPPWDPFAEAMLAGNDDYVDDGQAGGARILGAMQPGGAAEMGRLPFFDDEAA